ncbi:MAG: hypothetical protein KC478_10700 [Bacteriovoracaceae bacterium]|nr:hypothetical protein [Bacteriovoracaceae bacterium]
MSFNYESCSEEELWKYVASELTRNNVDVILVGGAVVSVYTEGAYKSGDLDFVLNDFVRTKLNPVMAMLGFTQRGRYYKHPKCEHLFIEFASFPASIGDDYNIEPLEVEHEGQCLKIFSPTDCVRDRLASYAYFSARECLDQAVMVAKKHPINFEKVKSWCKQEKIEKKYEDFISELQK